MSGADEDDKPTVVLDLNALKKQKQKQEEDLANIASELEFAIHDDEDEAAAAPVAKPARRPGSFPVVLLDLDSTFFAKTLKMFPKGFDYKIAKSISELNEFLKDSEYQLVIFNYDAAPKAAHQLCAQIRNKKPTVRTIIMAKTLDPSKTKAHAKSASGADGYYQHPFDASMLEKEFKKIYQQMKKAA